jgi:hypothetical protein
MRLPDSTASVLPLGVQDDRSMTIPATPSAVSLRADPGPSVRKKWRRAAGSRARSSGVRPVPGMLAQKETTSARSLPLSGARAPAPSRRNVFVRCRSERRGRRKTGTFPPWATTRFTLLEQGASVTSPTPRRSSKNMTAVVTVDNRPSRTLAGKQLAKPTWNYPVAR